MIKPTVVRLRRGREADFDLLVAHVHGQALLAINNTDRWVFNISYHPDTSHPDTSSPVDYPQERCLELVRAAVGLPGLDVRLLARNPWVPSASLPWLGERLHRLAL